MRRGHSWSAHICLRWEAALGTASHCQNVRLAVFCVGLNDLWHFIHLVVSLFVRPASELVCVLPPWGFLLISEFDYHLPRRWFALFLNQLSASEFEFLVPACTVKIKMYWYGILSWLKRWLELGYFWRPTLPRVIDLSRLSVHREQPSIFHSTTQVCAVQTPNAGGPRGVWTSWHVKVQISADLYGESLIFLN